MITNDDILTLLSEVVDSGSEVRLPVSGSSMGPAFSSVRDLVVRGSVATVISPGSLVVFFLHGRWAAHRVICVRQGAGGVEYLTKGDGLRQPDGPLLRGSEIKGVVVGLGLANGTTVDLQTFRARLSAWWIVKRFWIRRRIIPTGKGPKPAYRE